MIRWLKEWVAWRRRRPHIDEHYVLRTEDDGVAWIDDLSAAQARFMSAYSLWRLERPEWRR